MRKLRSAAGIWLACALIVTQTSGAGFGPAPTPTEADAVKNGNWGGQGASLVVTTAGGTIEFDCGHGTIDQAMELDSEGKFDVAGAHFGEGGRSRPDNPGQPARYRGTVTDDRLSLTVTLSQSDTTFGPFTLALGQRAVLRKCL